MYGAQVRIKNTMVNLDDTYRNLVLKGVVERYLSAGYHEISISPFQHSDLLCAVKHPGVSLSFLGYTYGDGGRTHIKVYLHQAGTLKIACYVPFYPLNTGQYGMVVYDGMGQMRFHSDHKYLSVIRTGNISKASLTIGEGLYLLTNSTYPHFSYKSEYIYSQTPVYEWVWEDQMKCGWVTKERYVCNYNPSTGRNECGYETYQVHECWNEPTYVYKQTGWEYWTYTSILAQKKLDYLHQTPQGILSFGVATVVPWTVVEDYTTAGSSSGIAPPTGVSGPLDFNDSVTATVGATVIVEDV